MSTRSIIAKDLNNGKVKYAYCHWDGYPDGVGRVLIENYNSENIDELLELKGFSTLKYTVEETEKNQCVDMEEISNECDKNDLFNSSNPYYGVEYVYVLEENIWYVYSYHNKNYELLIFE